MGNIRERRKNQVHFSDVETTQVHFSDVETTNDAKMICPDESSDHCEPEHTRGRTCMALLRIYLIKSDKQFYLALWMFLAFVVGASVYLYNQAAEISRGVRAIDTAIDGVPNLNRGVTKRDLRSNSKSNSNTDSTMTYSICNGLSDQLLGHASYIAGAIALGRNVRIPNIFVVNGVQTEEGGEEASVLKDALDNAVPLSQIIDTDFLIQVVQSYGVHAELEPFEEAVARHAAHPEPCNWLSALQSYEIAQKMLNSLRPSPSLANLVQTSIGNLLRQVDSTSQATLSDGVCLHHKNSLDWQEYCNQWENIEDGTWRKNCMNDRQLPLHELVRYRIPEKYPKSWIYYIGDEEPSEYLIEDFKGNGISLIHREKHNLLSDEDIAKAAHLKTLDISAETHRNLFEVVDYFTCAEIESFIGNSVSTFSANQIARRHGMKSTWYNSRSIPLASSFPVFHIPIVYTYTEESHVLGQKLLKASILSVRGAFGTSTDIHLLYHGNKDEQFLLWLKKYSVIIHHHEPQWLDMIETMRQNGDPALSHLFAHKGNYIGTWQRIDLPLFIDAEYILFLDSDTIIRQSFGMHDFGLDVTPGLAASSEFDEEDTRPWNVGVCLFNVPKLRETYDSFLDFIRSHTDSPVFNGNVSDQGAYLEFYASVTQFLDTIFNVKPYWTNPRNFRERKISHFHGLKPHDFLKIFMGYPPESWGQALRDVIWKIKRLDNACIVLHDFAKFISQDKKNLGHYCRHVFKKEGGSKVDECYTFFSELGDEEDSASSCMMHLPW
eukprot:CAMPEP_0196804684 /NCGR_PEP_ID=MMETSP1362-20130617/4344_1 /TAXON_ID=163516 /ORGANISM="Leptocylindrus danicus, Strain CCMP1856" /LENGTH=775 /DNA_ID=CAMNT_0042177147 /DNA_START=126 /DNA_END=2450 /DNA_ORIENTATION=+